MSNRPRRSSRPPVEYSTVVVSLYRFNEEFDRLWRENHREFNLSSVVTEREYYKDWCFTESLYRVTRMPIVGHRRSDEGRCLMDEDEHELLVRAVERSLPRSLKNLEGEFFFKVHCVGASAFISIPIGGYEEWEIRRLRTYQI